MMEPNILVGVLQFGALGILAFIVYRIAPELIKSFNTLSASIEHLAEKMSTNEVEAEKRHGATRVLILEAAKEIRHDLRGTLQAVQSNTIAAIGNLERAVLIAVPGAKAGADLARAIYKDTTNEQIP